VTPPETQTVNENDFLICRGNGNVRLVGKGYFPPSRMSDVAFPDTMIAARVSTDQVQRAFLQYVWNSPAVRSQVEALARTTNGTFKVNQTMLEGISFIVPPLPLQREFARRVRGVEKLKATQRASLAELDALFASLQHRAFRGEL
jgi:type I restriction enzyme, S subunit